MERSWVTLGGTLTVVTLGLGLTSCGEDPLPSQEVLTPIQQEERVVRIGGMEFLPVGTRVPRHVPLVAPPEPYYPDRHGPAKRNRRHENLAHPGQFGGRHLARTVPTGTQYSSSVEPARVTSAGDADLEAGYFLYEGDAGVYATMDAQLNFHFEPDEAAVWLYSSAIRAVGNRHGCLEMAVTHFREFANGPDEDEFWVWDHCAEDWEDPLILRENMNSLSWQDDYLRNMDPDGSGLEEMMYGEIYYPVGSAVCHAVYLYNFDSGQYDLKEESCRRQEDTDFGWTLWEAEWPDAYTRDRCRDLPGIRNSHVTMLEWISEDSKFLHEGNTFKYNAPSALPNCFKETCQLSSVELG